MTRFFKDPHKKILEFKCGKGDAYGCGMLVQTTSRVQVYCKHCQERVKREKTRAWHQANRQLKKKAAV